MKKYRVAVIGGAGTWGRKYLRAYANHPACEIVALVDRAEDRRQTFADRYNIGTVFDTLEDLLDREIPDIVSAILPTSHNPGVVIACAEAGVKVVSCEKPIAVELSQADEMVRICRERGTVFSCGSVYSGVPHLLETVDWIKAGNIGKLTAAAVPSGLPREVSGGGCVQLTLLQLLTGMEVEWGRRLDVTAGIRLDAAMLKLRQWKLTVPPMVVSDYQVTSSARFPCHRLNRAFPVRSWSQGRMGRYG